MRQQLRKLYQADDSSEENESAAPGTCVDDCAESSRNTTLSKDNLDRL